MEARQHDTLLLLNLIWTPLHASEHQERFDARIPLSAFQTKMGYAATGQAFAVTGTGVEIGQGA